MDRASQILRSPVAAVCVVIFLSDAATGIVSPTFSLFAQQLGVSLALLGIINTIGGVTQLASSFPLGTLSDRVSRLWLIRGGTISFVLALVSLALAEGAVNLFLARILMALGGFTVFRVAAAHLGDITVPGKRSLAFGAYATALGLGFTVGSFVGGQLADAFGSRTAFWVAAALAMSSFTLAWCALSEPDMRDKRGVDAVPFLAGFRQIAGKRTILLVSAANLLLSIGFVGAITTFFPIYAKDDALLTQAAIGTMFAIRGLVSTVGRVPHGVIARLIGTTPVMVGALAAQAIVMFGIWSTKNEFILTIFLAIEGLAWGAFLVASSAFIADNTVLENRGAATGLNTTASGIGATLSPLALGIVASAWGVAIVFPVAGVVLSAGFFVILGLSLALRERDDRVQPEYAG